MESVKISPINTLTRTESNDQLSNPIQTEAEANRDLDRVEANNDDSIFIQETAANEEFSIKQKLAHRANANLGHDTADQPKFEKFDEIIVGKVLSLLPPSERREKRLVCQLWRQQIDRRIGLNVTVNCLNRTLMDFLSQTILTTVRVKRLVHTRTSIANMSGGSETGSDTDNNHADSGSEKSRKLKSTKIKSRINPAKWLKFPQHVKTLIVDQSAVVDGDYLQEILSTCSANLKHLRIALQNLNSNCNHELKAEGGSAIGVESTPWQSRLLSLRTLQLVHNLTSSASVIPVVEQTCQILGTIEAPLLKYFSLYFNSNHVHLEMDYLASLQMALIKLLQQMTVTQSQMKTGGNCLTQLYLELRARAVAWTLPPHLLQSYLHRHEFSIETLNTISRSFNQLEDLVLRFPHTCGFRFWSLFSSHQHHLKKLVIQFADVKLHTLVSLVQQNSRTLETLSIFADVEREGIEIETHQNQIENSFPSLTPVSVDFQVLQECSQLKYLHLEIPYKEDRTVILQSIKFNGFPQTIERLDVGWLVISTTDIKLISNLPQLRHLSLIGCGEQDEFGVTVPILSDLFFNRNLQELFIYNINHHFKAVHMRRIVGMLNHLQRHQVRVHVRERAFYIYYQHQHRFSCHSEDGSKDDSSSKWSTSTAWKWGSASANHNWTRPPAVFVNRYAIDDKLCISV